MHPSLNQSNDCKGNKMDWAIELWSRFSVSFYQWAIRFLNLTSKYPSVDRSELECHDISERVTFGKARHLVHGRKFTRFLTIIYIFFLMLLFSFILIWANLVDRENPTRSLKFIRKGEWQLACLRTNCRQLMIGSNLADDLASLPLVAFCYPRFSSICPAVAHLDAIGIFVITIVCLYTILVGCVVPTYCQTSTKNNETITFIFDPEFEANVTLRRIEHHLERVMNSYECFVEYTLMSSRRKIFRKSYENYKRHVGSYYDHMQLRGSEQELLRYQVDCLPVVRTFWWQRMLASLASMNSIIYLSLQTLLVFLAFWSIEKGLQSKTGYIKTLQNQMLNANCSIWMASDESRQPLDLVEFSRHYLHWGYFSFLFYLFLCEMIVITILLLLTYVYITILELKCWLDELTFQILMAIEINRLQVPSGESSSNEAEKSGMLLAKLRRLFISESSIWQLSYLVRHRLTAEQLCMKIRRQQMALSYLNSVSYGPHVQVELLNKIYINLCLFIDHIKSQTPIASIIVIAVYILNIGFILVDLFFFEKLGEYSALGRAICVAGWMTTNIALFLVSNFHAKANKLPALMWSLRARMLWQSRDALQNAHLEIIWSRMTTSMQTKRLIMIQAFGYSISYINIIQIVLWSLTVSLITMKR